MNNSINQPQTLLVLGGNSDIARAIIAQLSSTALKTVVLACRSPETADTSGFADHVEVATVAFDATDHSAHAPMIERVAAAHGDLDVVIQAFGQLGGPEVNTDPNAAGDLVDVNFAGAVSSGLAVAGQLCRQGHGVLVVLSSVAGLRTRPTNFVYGATKAGQDAFATGLGHALAGSGAHVMTVRPGFVRSAMTKGMAEAPFSCDPSDVAEAVAAGLRSRKSVVWAPSFLRYVFAVLRVVPVFVWRRLDS